MIHLDSAIIDQLTNDLNRMIIKKKQLQTNITKSNKLIHILHLINHSQTDNHISKEDLHIPFTNKSSLMQHLVHDLSPNLTKYSLICT